MTIRYIPHRLTVPFETLAGSPEVRSTSTWAGDGATRKLKCLWIHRIALERELLGYYEYNGDNVLMHLPTPFSIDRPNLIATSIVITPLGKVSGDEIDTRFATYTHAVLNVTFEVATRLLSDRYGFVTLSEDVMDTTEFATLSAKNLYWGTGAGREQIGDRESPSKLSHGKEWLYTISGAYRVPSDIFDYVGKINISTVLSDYTGRSYASGTLLYASPSVASEITAGGMIYRITLRFLHKNNGTFENPRGWNWFPRHSLTGSDISYEIIYDDADNAKVFYEMADYRSVFA